MTKKELAEKKTLLNQKIHVIDLDRLDDINRIRVKVNNKELPIAIGDKIQFPDGDPMLKTISAIQINEDGIESYLIEWFEEGVFKQNWVSLTELKILKDTARQQKIIGYLREEFEEQQEKNTK